MHYVSGIYVNEYDEIIESFENCHIHYIRLPDFIPYQRRMRFL